MTFIADHLQIPVKVYNANVYSEEIQGVSHHVFSGKMVYKHVCIPDFAIYL